MLKSIQIKKFKSYLDATLKLSPLTVMIGANASGKSNAVEALRLISWLAQGQKLSAIQYEVEGPESLLRGRTKDLCHGDGSDFGFTFLTDRKEWNRLNIEIALRNDGLHVYRESIWSSHANSSLYYLDEPSEGQSSDVKVEYYTFSKGRKPKITCSDQMAVFTQIDSPASFGASHKQSQKIIPDVVTDYQTWLKSFLFLDLVPAEMHDYSFPSESVLQGNGANLSGILSNLWGGDDYRDQEPFVSNRRAILEFIQSLPEQNISKLSFLSEPRGGRMVALEETFGDKPSLYDASLLSDGTLRVLAIAAALLSAKEGSLVVIEEIDNGVHPSRAHHLLTQMRKIAAGRSLRILLTTHNPALLDALPDSAIPDVVFCYRDPTNGSSRLVRLADVPDYPELIAQGTLGHLMTSGVLERFVKHHPTGNERKQRALDWLEQLQSGTSDA